MRVSRFYLDAPLGAGEQLLDGDLAHYIGRVLRLGPGAPVQIFNGSGQEWPGEVLEVGKRQVRLQLHEPVAGQPESPLRVHLGQALSRGERMDWAIQKATELGASEITPLLTSHCEVRLNAERAAKRLEHWQQIAISACEQCGRSELPLIHPVTPLADWLAGLQQDLKLLLHPQAQPFASYQPPGSLALLIGPEGGLSQDDLDCATKHGFNGVSLGPRVLRTETAPVAALAIAQLLWGDFGYNANPN